MYRPTVAFVQGSSDGAEGQYPPDQLPGRRFKLRALRRLDWRLELALSHDVEARRWIPYPDDMDAEQARERLTTAEARTAAGLGRRFAIEAEDGRAVGTCGIAFGAEDPEISYAVLPHERGQGAATEATRLLTKWAFDKGHPRVLLRTDEGNWASEAVARRAGFSPSETTKELTRGVWVSVTRWNKQAPEQRSRPKRPAGEE